MTVTDCLSHYRQGVADSIAYMSSAYATKTDGTFLYSQAHRDFIVDAAFLKFYICWETFLESVFSSYLLGELSITGVSVPTCITARDQKHASEILIGCNKYFDWSNPELVRKLSKLYMEEENTIGNNILSIQNDLFDLKTIRNAAAHITVTTQANIDGLASRIMGHQQYNTTVSGLIMSNKPGTADTIFEYYKNILDATAECICKGSK